MAIFKIHYVQRVATPKVGLPESRFLCFVHCLVVLYTCKKFHEKSGKVFNLHSGQEWRVEMAMFNVQRAITPKVSKTRVTVHVFCKLSNSVLHLCEVSWKYLEWFLTYRADTSTW